MHCWESERIRSAPANSPRSRCRRCRAIQCRLNPSSPTRAAIGPDLDSQTMTISTRSLLTGTVWTTVFYGLPLAPHRNERSPGAVSGAGHIWHDVDRIHFEDGHRDDIRCRYLSKYYL